MLNSILVAIKVSLANREDAPRRCYGSCCLKLIFRLHTRKCVLWTVICYVSLWQCGGGGTGFGWQQKVDWGSLQWEKFDFCNVADLRRFNWMTSHTFRIQESSSPTSMIVYRDNVCYSGGGVGVWDSRGTKGFKWLSCLFEMFDSVKWTGERE